MKAFNKVFATLSFWIFICIAAHAQHKQAHSKANAQLLRSLRDSVIQDPNNLRLNENFITAWGIDNKDSTLIIQYSRWLKIYPNSIAMPYAIGKALGNLKNLKASLFLQKAVALDPNLSAAWFLLYKDAAARGDSINMCEYLDKAVKADTLNSEYAFYDAYQYRYIDPLRYRSMALNLADRFPAENTEEGVQAINFLILDEKDETKKIAYYEIVKNKFLNYRGYWYNTLMSGYFEYMLTIDPRKSLQIAAQLKNLHLNIGLADTVLQSKKLLIDKNADAAYSLIKNVQLKKLVYPQSMLLYKAQLADASKHTQEAFDSTALYYSKKPTDTLKKYLIHYGLKIGLTKEDILVKISSIRSLTAKVAQDFNFKDYFNDKQVSLKDFKGKIVV